MEEAGGGRGLVDVGVGGYTAELGRAPYCHWVFMAEHVCV